jgi:hypothetical protein
MQTYGSFGDASLADEHLGWPVAASKIVRVTSRGNAFAETTGDGPLRGLLAGYRH